MKLKKSFKVFSVVTLLLVLAFPVYAQDFGRALEPLLNLLQYIFGELSTELAF